MRMPETEVAKLALKFTRGVGSPTSIAIHTVLFVACFVVAAMGVVGWDRMLLVLTTIVSLEAIYLAIFIQMTINYTTESLKEVSADVEEIHGHVEEIQEDVGEIQEDVEEISEDVDELQEDVEEISEDVEEMSEDDVAEEQKHAEHERALSAIKNDLQKLLGDVERLKKTED